MRNISSRLIFLEVNPADVNEVLIGNVLQGGQGQAPARQVAVGAGILFT